ncbi:MAG: nitronate monooxygenase [Bacillota bacterium]
MLNICELIKTNYPLIQGGMANIADHRLASSVSNAGALGMIAAGGEEPERVREEIRLCRELTDASFGVNIMLMSPHTPDIARLVVEEKISVITTGAGNPGRYIAAWKEAGITVIPVIPSVAFALRVERAGADAVIVEGTEAGGHIGEQTTLALVPQVVDAVSIPVIAAGGVADYRQVLAVFVLGAKGIQAGTVFLTAEECPVHDNYKQFVIKAKDTDTTVTGRQTGAPVRVLKNKMARRYNKLAAGGAPLEELEKMTLGSLKRAVLEGDLDTGSFMAGQVAGMVRSVRPVQEIIKSLFDPVEEYRRNLRIL